MLYVISDLHLSFQASKPMDIFGENWANHEEKIKKDWISKVKEDDTVLLPGDFSWAMSLDETKKDFQYLCDLPGRKIMLKGNHDYWWNGLKKLNEFIETNNFNNIDFLYNNAFESEGYIIAGTRGWSFYPDEDDKKIEARELIRLELSLKYGIEKYGNDKEIIVCMHYPPTNKHLLEKSEFICLMKKYNVKKCYYGHLHSEAQKEACEGDFNGIYLKLVSADYVDFKLTKVV